MQWRHGMKRRLSAVEARKKLGEILDGVYYRGDEVVIERAGKPLAVVVPMKLYEQLGRGREEFWKLLVDTWEQNKDLTTEELAEIESEIDDAVQSVRAEMREKRLKNLPVKA